MKKTNIILCCLLLLFVSCKHEQILPDTEYLNAAAYYKLKEYSNEYEPGSLGVLSISSNIDSKGKEQLHLDYHINYNHTLDAIKVDINNWLKLPYHSGSDVISSSLSSNKHQNVPFQIRSKMPQGEVMNGEVLVPRQSPITVTDLGNNTFKIKWAAQYRRQKVLIHLYAIYAYIQPYYNGRFAVETDDDGEYTLLPSVFEKFEKKRNELNINSTLEPMQISLSRNTPNRKTIVKQPSTGAVYTVYGGTVEVAKIDVLIK